MDDEKAALFAELRESGIKHSPEKVVRIAKQVDGKIVFLEEGKAGRRGSGLAHILKEHQENFSRRGISENEIPDAVMAAITRGTFIGYQGTIEPRREIYEVIFNGKTQYIAVTVGDNGYIVGANPASLP
ncbi:hypothetical protein H6G33_16310 [Calothrix sp. FACHB-1219]|uniref:hypothetical protein n=1 Tax=unclassified Calothrix TaxID=2619626 RepID=UPI001682194D|nr:MULTISPECIES: hypothetical protein [unclassified Calothrix]MBD2206780.1 hypothetical protein [Calothrix sp. FACHB-168]MBD2218598.1 hypothetical protein [Calothrix sp. FACHB-1219]